MASQESRGRAGREIQSETGACKGEEPFQELWPSESRGWGIIRDEEIKLTMAVIARK
jgi:hypothetical protein